MPEEKETLPYYTEDFNPDVYIEGGYELAATPEEGRTRALEALAARTQLTRGQMDIPGWNDVIHIVPDRALPIEEQIKRKQIRARNIASAPSTQLSKDVTWYMTQVDNIQDGLVTLAVGLRLAGLAIPAARPAAIWTGKAADKLAISQVIKAFRKAPTQAKRGAENAMKGSTGYYVGRVKGATNLRKALPNVPEVLQILQTSDQLTGVGISLGAVMGQPLAAVSHLMSPIEMDPRDPRRDRPGMTGEEINEYLRRERPEEYARAGQLTAAYGVAAIVSIAQPATLALSIITETIGKIQDYNQAAPPAELDAAAQIMDATTLLGGNDHTFSSEDHLLMSTAYSLALDICARDRREIPAAAIAPLLLDKPRRPPPCRNPTTRIALQSIGINPDAPAEWPFTGRPTATTTREIIAEILPIAGHKLTSWRNALETEDEQSYASFLHTHQARAPWAILEGPNIEMQHGYIPQGRALIAILSLGILPPEDFPDDLLWPLLTELGARWFTIDTNHPRYDQAITDVHEMVTRLTS